MVKMKNDFQSLGFHGDKYLIDKVSNILSNCDYFIETGSYVGSTLHYVASRFPQLHCLSCEPSIDAFKQLKQNISDVSNVTIYNLISQDFLVKLEVEHNDTFDKNVMFWLDAHSVGFKWPLKEEISFITRHYKSGYIFIDDFLVPNMPQFGYDTYVGQTCSFDYIKDDINPDVTYTIEYPTYTEKTSTFHGLRGWGLITFKENSL